MPKNKITTILSEIDKFFDKKDASSAMFNIMRTINSLRLSEKVLFGRVSKCNQVYSLLSVFVCLLISPCFMIRNPYHYSGSPLSGLMNCKKDVFYDFLRDVRINWRKLMRPALDSYKSPLRPERQDNLLDYRRHRLSQDRQENGTHRACPLPPYAQEHPWL